MNLFPDEQKILVSNGDKIVLTDHRIQKTDSTWGQSFTISIFLENISSVEIKYKSDFIFIILAVLSFVAGAYMQYENGQNFLVGGVVVGLVFLILWWASRKHIVSISSNGGSKLIFLVEQMKQQKISDFIDAVSLAKYNRINTLYKR